MYSFYERVMDVETSIKSIDDALREMRKLPFPVFAKAITFATQETPYFSEFLPVMPTPDVQRLYNGRDGMSLLSNSVGFMQSVINAYIGLHNAAPKPDLTFLDYGFGWGRLLRMAYYYASPENIYGLDPQQKSIDLCDAHRVKAKLGLCDEVPTRINVPANFFDIIYSFSVFTHLSEPAALAIIHVLRQHIKHDGMLAITIRPIEFWAYYESVGRITSHEKEHLLEQHKSNGYAYIPLKGGWPTVNGIINFGDTSMSLEYIKETWKGWNVVGTDMTFDDPYQIHVFLSPTP